MRRRQLARIAIGVVVATIAGCATPAPGSIPPPEESADVEASRRSATPSLTVTATASPSASVSLVDASHSTNSIAALIRAAAHTTTEAGTMRFQVEVRPSVPVEGVTSPSGYGQVSFADPIQFRYLSHANTGLGGTSPEYEVIFDDPRIFLRGREALLESPETWFTFRFDELGLGEIQRKRYLHQNAEVLLLLVPAFGVLEAELVGPETLHGGSVNRVLTTHYQGVSRLDVPTEQLPESAREVSMDWLAALSASEASRSIDVDFWIDETGRIVRLTYVQEVEDGAIQAFIATYDFDSFGAPMDLSVPEGAEVLTIDQLLERARSSASASPSS